MRYLVDPDFPFFPSPNPDPTPMSTEPKDTKETEGKKEEAPKETSKTEAVAPKKEETSKQETTSSTPKATPTPKAVKVKKLHKDAMTPVRGTEKSSGLDLICTEVEDTGDFLICSIGIAVEIPEGYTGYLHARSSVMKKDLVLANGVGVIDEDYRGEVKAVFRKVDKLETVDGRTFTRKARNMYAVGDKVAQLVILRDYKMPVKLVKELSDTDRGTGGFGSTGN